MGRRVTLLVLIAMAVAVAATRTYLTMSSKATLLAQQPMMTSEMPIISFTLPMWFGDEVRKGMPEEELA